MPGGEGGEGAGPSPIPPLPAHLPLHSPACPHLLAVVLLVVHQLLLQAAHQGGLLLNTLGQDRTGEGRGGVQGRRDDVACESQGL